jgi:hypothetical protein
VDDGLRETNPAARRRGRGKRAGRSRNRGPEKVITDALGILLIAERAALLSGRDDEFVACVTKGYTGIRWGELLGLETQFIRPGSLRVEWQLYELDGGEFHRCPPKDDSYRTIDTPDFLSGLLSRHVAGKRPEPCACHGLRYAFNGYSAGNGAASRPGAKAVDVARKAGVSTGTVSNFFNGPRPYLTASVRVWRRPSPNSGTSATPPQANRRPTGDAAASLPGSSIPPPPAPTRPGLPTTLTPSRCSPSPGPASPPAAREPPTGQRPAGCPSLRA